MLNIIISFIPNIWKISCIFKMLKALSVFWNINLFFAVFKFNFSLTLSTRAIAAFPYSFDETSISVGLYYSNSSFSYRSSCSSFDKSLTQLSNISSWPSWHYWIKLEFYYNVEFWVWTIWELTFLLTSVGFWTGTIVVFFWDIDIFWFFVA